MGIYWSVWYLMDVPPFDFLGNGPVTLYLRRFLALTGPRRPRHDVAIVVMRLGLVDRPSYKLKIKEEQTENRNVDSSPSCF